MAANEPFTIYLGWDDRETVASEVAAHSIRRRTFSKVNIKFLKHRELRQSGFFMRPWLIDGKTGDSIDIMDGRKFSTQYSHTRFLVPALQNYKGWALYSDGDMLFTKDIKKLFALADDRYAVMCVKHKIQPSQNASRLDNRLKQQYFRKNWSSLMLINCAHPANKHLSKDNVNLATGEELHSFCWLDDHEIGELPFTHNYISGQSKKIEVEEGHKFTLPDSIHFTEAAPWNGEHDIPYAANWTAEYEEWCRDADHGKKVNELPKTTYDR